MRLEDDRIQNPLIIIMGIWILHNALDQGTYGYEYYKVRNWSKKKAKSGYRKAKKGYYLGKSYYKKRYRKRK
jgi:hypothetical protein